MARREKTDDEYFYLVHNHMKKPARSVGTSDPVTGDQEETPTKDLPPVEGDQRRERVRVG